MKKRGQFPNAQTYTILFRGLAKSQHPRNAVAEATKLYNLLKNDRRLQPNIIHVNAILHVCSRAFDIDQLFLVAGDMENLGLTPTTATYGSIFNAMRMYVRREYQSLDRDTEREGIEKMLDRANKIWVEVMEKWQQGKIRLDESLICTIGRLQLLDKNRGKKLQVLSLLEKTMNIPNLVVREHPPKPADAEKTTTTTTTATPSDTAAVTTSKPKAAFVTPGQNTLALILTTLLTARKTSAAAPYWNLFVNDMKLVPDNDNWLRMIGMLKLSKSSAQAAQILDTLPADGIEVEARSFAIAMEACVRDNINPHVMTHATRILRTMQARLAPEPDLQTMRLYLRVALVSHAAFRGRAGTGDQVGAKAAYGQQIATALAELWHPYIDVYNRCFKSDAARATSSGADKRAVGILYNKQKEVIALGRMMVGAFSKVVEEQMLPGNNNRDMIIASAKINKGIQAFFADRELREPGLNKKAAEEGAGELAEGQEKQKSPFDINMPELDDTIDERLAPKGKPGRDGKGKGKEQVRHGADFVWNTRKSGNAKAKPAQASKWDADKPVIDRWISTPATKDQPPKQEGAKNDEFIPIKPVIEDADAAGTSTPEHKAKIAESNSSSQADTSVWASLMAERKQS